MSVPQRGKFYTKPEVSVQVALRARPLLPDERYLAKSKSVVKFLGGLSNQVEIKNGGSKRNFTFDFTLDPTVSQERVYIQCVLPIVRSFFTGYHGTVFAYGATGSGKTHTMGSGINHKLSSRELGVIPRVVADIFRLIQMEQAQALQQGKGEIEHEIRISCLEIYKERIQDLLHPDTDPSEISIRETSSGDTTLLGVGEKKVKSYDEVMAYFERASTLRTTSATLLNAQSSRSHAIYTITLKKKQRAMPRRAEEDGGWEDDGAGRNKKARYASTLSSKLHLVDLAGSEAVSKSGVKGVQFDEAKAINKSLLTLGNVISILGNANGPVPRGTHIPYRASKLTRLLKNSLGGNSRTLMIACVSPADLHVTDTLNTLNYANRARSIRNKPVMNKEDVMSPEQFKKMKQEMDALRAQLRQFKDGDGGGGGGGGFGGGGGGGGLAGAVNVGPDYLDKIERLLLLEKEMRERGMGQSKAFVEGKMLEVLQRSEERYAEEIDGLKAHITEMEREIRARRLSKGGGAADAGLGGNSDGRVRGSPEDADLQRLQNDVSRLKQEHKRLLKARNRSGAELDTELVRRNAGQEQQIEQLHANQLRMEAAVRALQENIQQKQEQLISLSRTMDMRAMEAAQRASLTHAAAGGLPVGFAVGQNAVIIEEPDDTDDLPHDTDDLAEFTRAPRAEFNYFHPRDLPPAYRRVLVRLKVDLVMGSLERQFGFQEDSVECQLDHACFLLSNLASHPAVMRERASGERAGRPHADDELPALEAAVSVAHAKLLLNYYKWCRRVGAAPNTAPGDDVGARVREVCLFLLAWGEASNVRHMPEAMAFLFHGMVREMHDNVNGAPRRPGSYLEHVVRPLYKVLQSNRQNRAVQRVNYDDVNEFFWTRKCLKHEYATPAYFTECFMDEDELRAHYGDDYDVFMAVGGFRDGPTPGNPAAADADGDDDDDDAKHAGGVGNLEWKGSMRSLSHSAGESGVPLRKDGGNAQAVSLALPRAPKTFVEKQSFLNPLRSFHRVFFFFVVMFQLQACLAYVLDHLTCEVDRPDPDPLCGTHRSFEAQRIFASVAVGAALLSLFKELLDAWARWGIFATNVGGTLRLGARVLVKGVVALALGAMYYWSWTEPDTWWDTYRSLAVLYLGLHVLEIVRQMVPPLSRAVDRLARAPGLSAVAALVSPVLGSEEAYVGTDVSESTWDTFKYQAFWVVTLTIKMYSSWLFQVRPLIDVTDKLWDTDIRGSLLLPEPLPNLILIVMIWIPFVLVYFADTMIWFAVVQAVYGVWVGLAARLGGIHNFKGLARAFVRAPGQFAGKVLWDREADVVGHGHRRYEDSVLRGHAPRLAKPSMSRANIPRSSSSPKIGEDSPFPTPRVGAPAPLQMGALPHDDGDDDDAASGDVSHYLARQRQRKRQATRQNLLAAEDDDGSENGSDDIEAAVAAADAAAEEQRETADDSKLANIAGDWSRLVAAYQSTSVQLTEPIPQHELRRGLGAGDEKDFSDDDDADEGGSRAAFEPDVGIEALERAKADKDRAQWTRFALTWNEVVADMRRNDLVSNEEEHMLQFRFVSDKRGNRIKYYMPLALTASSVEAVLQELQEFADEAKDSRPRQRQRLEALLFETLAAPGRKIHREAVMEAVELTEWLTSTLLGHAHAAEMGRVFGFLEDTVTDMRVLQAVRVDRLREFKSKLLGLIRGCRKAFKALKTKVAREAKRRQQMSPRAGGARDTGDTAGPTIRDSRSRRSRPPSPRARSKAKPRRGLDDDDDDDDYEGDDSDLSGEEDMMDEKHGEEVSRTGSFYHAAPDAMHGLIKTPSADTLAMLDTMRRDEEFEETGGLADHVFMDAWESADASAQVGAAYVNMLRDGLRALLRALGRSVNPNVAGVGVGDEEAGPGFERADAREGFVNPLNDVLLDADGFFWNDEYAAERVQELLEHRMCEPALEALEASLTLTPLDTQPQSEEAKRRLFFFVNSLAMDMPYAPRIANMVSCSTLTPFYTEDVVYSYNDMVKETPGGVSTFFYLQTIYPHEWANFLQRVGLSGRGVKEGVNLSQDEKIIEARLWATRRGQTLYRTVEGMMLYERALRFLSDLEEPGQNREALCQNVLLKYTYVVSCQVYGQQKRTLDPKADDIEYLLMRWPSLRIAYIDYVKVPEYDAEGNLQVREEYYSVLIKAVRLDEDGRPVYGYADPSSGSMFANSDSAYVDRKRYRIEEVYRVRLPGNPLIGEGKPENQCHSIVFTRGEVMQAIDMNQENYFEEAIKLRNLLQEFGRKPHRHPTRIVGFRETVYTAGLSSVAGYMALQELTFATLTQRVLDEPLRIRFHYGHPDLFDKMYCMNNGGVSKASKSINLNEDVFAGFNTVLRGGSVTMNEYVTVGKGREVGLQQLFKFEAKLGAGAAMQAMSRDIYRLANRFDFFRLMSFFFGGVGFYLGNSVVILALFFFMYSRLLVTAFGATEARDDPGVEAISYWFGQIGFVLTLPQFASLLLERGLRLALWDILKMLGTGGPIFFVFNMGTKAHLFEQTLLAGGARYRATGRGFLTKHEKFSELFRFYSFSHFDKALELMMLLVMYGVVFDGNLSYGIVTWPAWLLVASWFFAPFWFNPMAFDWERTLEDAQDFFLWMRRKENDPARSWRSWYVEETEFLDDLDFLQKVRISLFSLRHFMVGVALLYWRESTTAEVMVCVIVLLVMYITHTLMRARVGPSHHRALRTFKGLFVTGLLVAMIAVPLHFGVSFNDFMLGFVTFFGVLYMLATIVTIGHSFGVRPMFFVRLVQVYDFVVGTFLLIVVGTLSILVIPAYIQTRLMFYNAFSRGVMISRLLQGSTERASAVLDTDSNYELGKSGKKPALRKVLKEKME